MECRVGWRALCKWGIDELVEDRQSQSQREAAKQEMCNAACAKRKFRSESGKKRPKCLEERKASRKVQ